MEESSGAQFALQVALQTLRDRCQQFQQRIADLECENLDLRSRCNANNNSKYSLPEIETLQLQVSQLTEQKLQLHKKIEMVTAENNNLWSRLSKLTQVKEHLDSKLTKINNTISHTNLVRSQTFTQAAPLIVFAPDTVQQENEKLSLELEDISLKLLNNIAKEKEELEMQCSQMTEMQQIDDVLFSNSYAFIPFSEDDSEYGELEKQVASLKSIKFALLKQKEKLETVYLQLTAKPFPNCPTCSLQKNITVTSAQTNNNNLIDEETVQLQSLQKWGTPEDSFHAEESPFKEITNKEDVNLCPMCSKIFYNSSKFDEFRQHVEQHFILENDSTYEIV